MLHTALQASVADDDGIEWNHKGFFSLFSVERLDAIVIFWQSFFKIVIVGAHEQKN